MLREAAVGYVVCTDSTTVVVAHLDRDATAVVRHVVSRIRGDRICDCVTTGFGKSKLVVVDGPINDLVSF